jgi:hypothetical protein
VDVTTIDDEADDGCAEVVPPADPAAATRWAAPHAGT